MYARCDGVRRHRRREEFGGGEEELEQIQRYRRGLKNFKDVKAYSRRFIRFYEFIYHTEYTVSMTIIIVIYHYTY